MNKSLVLMSALGLSFGLAPVHAQAPAARGGAARGGAPLSAAQSAAVSAVNASTALEAQNQAVTAARTAINQATFAQPFNAGALATAIQSLATAEQALAGARADLLVKVQDALKPLTPDQAITALGQAPAAGGRGGGAPINYSDYTGFTALWDGKTLNNWDGETDVWSIDHDAIHADTVKTPGQHHIHFTGPGYVMKDFDFRVEVKMSGNANGGIQYRSRLLSPAHGEGRTITSREAMADPFGKPLPAGITTAAQATAAGIAGGNPWQMSGYQFDMNTGNNYVGQLYEGQGRGIVTAPGNFVRMTPTGNVILGKVNDNPNGIIKPHLGIDGEWQQFEIIARGNTLIHLVNGHIMSVTIDDDPGKFAPMGGLSLQLEGSGQIWYRNVYFKDLTGQ
jgi:hypothetical protein